MATRVIHHTDLRIHTVYNTWYTMYFMYFVYVCSSHGKCIFCVVTLAVYVNFSFKKSILKKELWWLAGLLLLLLVKRESQ